MRRHVGLLLAGVLALAPLGGCGTLQSLTGAVPEVQLRATQVEFVAESAFAASSAALEKAVDAGVLKGDDAARAQVAYRRAYEGLKTMRAALAAGHAILGAASAQESINASGEVNALAKGG